MERHCIHSVRVAREEATLPYGTPRRQLQKYGKSRGVEETFAWPCARGAPLAWKCCRIPSFAPAGIRGATKDGAKWPDEIHHAELDGPASVLSRDGARLAGEVLRRALRPPTQRERIRLAFAAYARGHPRLAGDYRQRRRLRNRSPGFAGSVPSEMTRRAQRVPTRSAGRLPRSFGKSPRTIIDGLQGPGAGFALPRDPFRAIAGRCSRARLRMWWQFAKRLRAQTCRKNR